MSPRPNFDVEADLKGVERVCRVGWHDRASETVKSHQRPFLWILDVRSLRGSGERDRPARCLPVARRLPLSDRPSLVQRARLAGALFCWGAPASFGGLAR